MSQSVTLDMASTINHQYLHLKQFHNTVKTNVICFNLYYQTILHVCIDDYGTVLLLLCTFNQWLPIKTTTYQQKQNKYHVLNICAGCSIFTSLLETISQVPVESLNERSGVHIIIFFSWIVFGQLFEKYNSLLPRARHKAVGLSCISSSINI